MGAQRYCSSCLRSLGEGERGICDSPECRETARAGLVRDTLAIAGMCGVAPPRWEAAEGGFHFTRKASAPEKAAPIVIQPSVPYWSCEKKKKKVAAVPDPPCGGIAEHLDDGAKIWGVWLPECPYHHGEGAWCSSNGDVHAPIDRMEAEVMLDAAVKGGHKNPRIARRDPVYYSKPPGTPESPEVGTEQRATEWAVGDICRVNRMVQWYGARACASHTVQLRERTCCSVTGTISWLVTMMTGYTEHVYESDLERLS